MSGQDKLKGDHMKTWNELTEKQQGAAVDCLYSEPDERIIKGIA